MRDVMVKKYPKVHKVSRKDIHQLSTKRGGSTRRGAIDAIELANNSIFLGTGKVIVVGDDGQEEGGRGYYFRATDGSATGIAMHSTLHVFRVSSMGRDGFVAVTRPAVANAGLVESKPSMSNLLERFEREAEIIPESRTRRTPPEKQKAWYTREGKGARKSTSRKSRHKGKAALKKGDYDGAGDKSRGTEGRLTH